MNGPVVLSIVVRKNTTKWVMNGLVILSIVVSCIFFSRGFTLLVVIILFVSDKFGLNICLMLLNACA